MEFRAATVADAAAIAAFHVAVWRETYGAVAPPAVVAALDEAHRLTHWAAGLAGPEAGWGCVLALEGGALAGLVSFGPAKHPVFAGRGEVTHLYVGAGHRQKGLARMLLLRAFEALGAAGFAQAGLAVLRANAGARAAYARLGGVELAGFTDAGPLWPSDNILVVWDDLKGRLAPAGAGSGAD